MSIRDQLRQKALKTSHLKRERFTYDGSDFEIMEPTVGDQKRIKQLAKDPSDNLMWTLIVLTVVPDTNERVFEDTDFKLFLEKAFGDSFIEAASDALLNIFKTMGAVEEGKQ